MAKQRTPDASRGMAMRTLTRPAALRVLDREHREVLRLQKPDRQRGIETRGR